MTEASPFSDLGCYNLFIYGGCFSFLFFSFLFSHNILSLRKTHESKDLLAPSFLPSFLFSLFFSHQDEFYKTRKGNPGKGKEEERRNKTTKSKKRKHKIVRVKQPPRVITPCEDQTSGQRLNLHRKQLKWRHTWEASPNRRTR